MILLDKRSYALLNYLLKLEEPETIMSISKVLHQSRRKTYYHLDKINEALPVGVDKIIAYPRIGILLNERQRTVCHDLMNRVDDYSYVMSAEERQQLILIYISVASDRVTIDKIMNLTDVSRNTVLNDLQEIRQKLADDAFGINLQVSKSEGYFLACQVLTKIQFSYKLLQTIIYKGSDAFKAIVYQKIKEHSSDNLYFSQGMRNYLNEQMKSLSDKLGKKVNRYDRQFMAEALPYLLSAYRSMILSKEDKLAFNREFSLARKRKEYSLVQDLAEGIYQTFDLRLDELEKSIAALLILSFRKDCDQHADSPDYDDMRQQLNLFLKKFETLYHSSFDHRELLLDQLVAHCKSMIYRKTFNIPSINPLTNQIKKNYKQLFAQTKSCADVLEKAWLLTLTDDDIAYLTIHLGGELAGERQTETRLDKAKVTLVCDDGVGAQRFFLRQCRRVLPHIHIDAVFTSEQFHSIHDLLTSNFVITTTDAIVLDSPVPILQVHAILTDEDSIRMVGFIRGEKDEVSSLEEKLRTSVHSYVKDSKEAYILVKEIKNIFYQELLKDVKEI